MSHFLKPRSVFCFTDVPLLLSHSLICWEQQSVSQLGVFAESALPLPQLISLGYIAGSQLRMVLCLSYRTFCLFIMENFTHIQKEKDYLNELACIYQ